MAKRKESRDNDKWAGGSQRAQRGNFDCPRFEMKSGRNYFVVIEDDFGECYQHWTKKPGSGGESIRSFNCAGGPEGQGDAPDQCTCCSLDNGDVDSPDNAYVDNTRHRYFLKVLPVKFANSKKSGKKVPRVSQKEIQLLEIGPMIFKGIVGIRQDILDDETGGYEEKGISSVTDTVIEVKRIGSGRDTEYAIKDVEIRLRVAKILSEVDDEVDLDAFARPDSNSRMRAFIGLDKPDGDGADDDDDDEDIDLDAGEDEDSEDDDDDEIDLDGDDDDDDE